MHCLLLKAPFEELNINSLDFSTSPLNYLLLLEEMRGADVTGHYQRPLHFHLRLLILFHQIIRLHSASASSPVGTVLLQDYILPALAIIFLMM